MPIQDQLKAEAQLRRERARAERQANQRDYSRPRITRVEFVDRENAEQRHLRETYERNLGKRPI